MTKSTDIDILTFDTVADCETPTDVALKLPDGTETGVILQVLGKHSTPVQRWIGKVTAKSAREQAAAQKSGRQVEPLDYEQLKSSNIEGAMARVVGWKNVKQDFSPALLRDVLSRNPEFVDQIVEASNDLGNFTKASLKV